MLVYRLTHKDYSKALHAPGLAGRWNSSGKKVIYCAESVAVAMVENMIRRKGLGFNKDFRTMIIYVPDQLGISLIQMKDLKQGWDDGQDYFICQEAGDRWYDEGKTPLLKVPSMAVPGGFNFVINAMHADFEKIALVDVQPFIPDTRIEDILKKYPSR